MKTTALTLAAVLMAGTASAATTAFTLDISGSQNLPRISVSNVGDMGDISSFTLSLGDTSFNFDTVDFINTVGDFSFDISDDIDMDSGGGLRADSIGVSFMDFNPGESFGFRTDVDEDNRNSSENYIETLLPGGSIVVNFLGGVTDSLFIDLTRPAGEGELAAYSYTASATVAAVPLPAGLPLLLAGLGALGIARRKRG